MARIVARSVPDLVVYSLNLFGDARMDAAVQP